MYIYVQGVPEKNWFLNFPADLSFGPLWAIWATLGHLENSGPFGPLWAIWTTLGHLGHFGPFGPLCIHEHQAIFVHSEQLKLHKMFNIPCYYFFSRYVSGVFLYLWLFLASPHHHLSLLRHDQPPSRPGKSSSIKPIFVIKSLNPCVWMPFS